MSKTDLVNIDESELLAEEAKQEFLSIKDLDEQLKKVNNEITDVLFLGATPELVKLSADMYQKYLDGDLESTLINEHELLNFIEERKKHIALKLISFLELASTAALSSKKLERATVKDLTSAMQFAMQILNGLMDKAPPAQKHVHEHKHAVVDKSELSTRITQTREKLKAIDAEFEEIEKDNILVDV